MLLEDLSQNQFNEYMNEVIRFKNENKLSFLGVFIFSLEQLPMINQQIQNKDIDINHLDIALKDVIIKQYKEYEDIYLKRVNLLYERLLNYPQLKNSFIDQIAIKRNWIVKLLSNDDLYWDNLYKESENLSKNEAISFYEKNMFLSKEHEINHFIEDLYRQFYD